MYEQSLREATFGVCGQGRQTRKIKRKRTRRNAKDLKGESEGLGKGYHLEYIFHKDPVLVVKHFGCGWPTTGRQNRENRR
jgi:hypothetical protein